MTKSNPSSLFKHIIDIMNLLQALLLLCFGCTSESSNTPVFPELPELHSVLQKQAVTSQSMETMKSFSIALVGDVRGELEPCGCPTLPFGGFERRQTLLQQEIKQHAPLFQLDAGELLLKGFFSNKGEASQIEERAKTLAQLSKMVGVDAWTVGPSDIMAVGLENLKTLDGPPRICATWLTQEGEWIFDPFIILQKDNIRLAVIGLSDALTDPEWSDKMQYLDAQSAIQKVLPEIPKDVDLIIGLGSMDDEQATALANLIPEVALLLTTEGSTYQDPNYAMQPFIIEAPSQGRFVQMMHFRLNAPFNTPLYQEPSEQHWRNWLTAHDANPNLQMEFEELGKGRNLFFSELIPLNASYNPTEDTDITKILGEFAIKRFKLSEEIATQPTTKSEPGFAASGRCAQCHTQEIAKWTYSNHARAWESLVNYQAQHQSDEKNTFTATQNPECIQCHSTGFGQIGGFGEVTASNIRKFKAVQCEMCHGPMKGHPNDKSIHSSIISEQTCLPCHNEANSPNFDFETYLPKATCQNPE